MMTTTRKKIGLFAKAILLFFMACMFSVSLYASSDDHSLKAVYFDNSEQVTCLNTDTKNCFFPREPGDKDIRITETIQNQVVS